MRNKILKISVSTGCLNQCAQTFQLPWNPTPVAVMAQNGGIAIWFEVDEGEPDYDYKIATVGTGIDFKKVEIPANAVHLGVALSNHDLIPHHVYGWQV